MARGIATSLGRSYARQIVPNRTWLLVAVATAFAALSPMGAEGAGITPANGLIAFVSTTDVNEWIDPAAGIAIASPDGSDKHLLTRTVPGVGAPAWSPDGRHVALMFGSSIALVSADGRDLRRIPHPADVRDRSPAWSPSGRLAFLRIGLASGSESLVVTDGNGRRQRTVFRSPQDGETIEDRPVWSRDGRTVALLGNLGRDGQFSTMRVVDAATGRHVLRALPRQCGAVPIPAPNSNSAVCVGKSRVTAGGEPVSKLWLSRPGHARVIATGEGVNYPAWSRDGTRIAYSHGPILGPSPSLLVVLTLATGRSRTFTVPERMTGGYGLQPSWSKDDRRIVVGHGTDLRWLVATVDVRTAAVRTLLTHTRDVNPRWSPDGKLLAYLHLTGSGDTELRVRALQGTSRTIAHRVAAYDFTAADVTPTYAWSPDAATIAFVSADGKLTAVSADGTYTRTLAADAFASPVWSPDGATIAYTTSAGTIAVIGAEGSASLLTPPPGRAATVAWSPDGASLLYVTPAAGDLASPLSSFGEPALWTFATKRSQPLFPAGALIAYGAWSPDGTKVYLTSPGFSGTPEGSVFDLWNPADSLPAYEGGFGTWSPDGTSIAFNRYDGINVVPLPARGGLWQPSAIINGSDPSWQPLAK
jgi:Tol biopolymer transport system component